MKKFVHKNKGINYIYLTPDNVVIVKDSKYGTGFYCGGKAINKFAELEKENTDLKKQLEIYKKAFNSLWIYEYGNYCVDQRDLLLDQAKKEIENDSRRNV